MILLWLIFVFSVAEQVTDNTVSNMSCLLNCIKAISPTAASCIWMNHSPSACVLYYKTPTNFSEFYLLKLDILPHKLAIKIIKTQTSNSFCNLSTCIWVVDNMPMGLLNSVTIWYEKVYIWVTISFKENVLIICLKKWPLLVHVKWLNTAETVCQ